MVKAKGVVLAAVLLLSSAALAEDIVVGPEGKISCATKGFIELNTGRDTKRNVLIQASRIIALKSGAENDNNSDHELIVEAGGGPPLVIRISQRVLTYDSIKNVIMDALR
jgi:hypothetical protein